MMLKRVGLFWIGALMMTGCGMFPIGKSHERVTVIAHRGASAYAPENTLASFALAAKMNADWAELDCQLTHDGEVIVAHDPTVNRTTNGKGRIVDFNLAELKRFDAGSWKGFNFTGERLPTLAETLELAKREKIGLYIEIKDVSVRKKGKPSAEEQLERKLLELSGDRVITRDPALAREVMQTVETSGTPNLPLTRKTLALVKAAGMEQGVVIQSFSPVVCAIARIEAPELRVELLGDPKPAAWPDFLRFAHLTGAQGGNLSEKATTPERVKALHAEGRSIAVWTVDDPAAIRRLVQMGVDAIITNRPDTCLSALQEIGRR